LIDKKNPDSPSRVTTRQNQFHKPLTDQAKYIHTQLTEDKTKRVEEVHSMLNQVKAEQSTSRHQLHKELELNHSDRTLEVSTLLQSYRTSTRESQAEQAARLRAETAQRRATVQAQLAQLRYERRFGTAPKSPTVQTATPTTQQSQTSATIPTEEPTQLAAEKLAADKLTAEQLAADKLAADKLTADKLAADKLAADKLTADKLTADKLAAEQLAADKLTAEKLVAEQLAAEKLVADKLAAEKLVAEQLAATQLAADKEPATQSQPVATTPDAQQGQTATPKPVSKNRSTTSKAKRPVSKPASVVASPEVQPPTSTQPEFRLDELFLYMANFLGELDLEELENYFGAERLYANWEGLTNFFEEVRPDSKAKLELLKAQKSAKTTNAEKEQPDSTKIFSYLTLQADGVTIEELEQQFSLKRSQLNSLLKKLVETGKVRKNGKSYTAI